MSPAVIDRDGPLPADSGYTLLELLVVIAIISLIVSAAPAVYSNVVPTFQVRQYANDLATQLRQLRDRSRATSTVSVIDFDSSSEASALSAIGVAVPDGATATFEPAEIWATDGMSQLQFFPTGSSNGGTITLRKDTLEVVIHIDWVSGAVQVEQ